MGVGALPFPSSILQPEEEEVWGQSQQPILTTDAKAGDPGFCSKEPSRTLLTLQKWHSETTSSQTSVYAPAIVLSSFPFPRLPAAPLSAPTIQIPHSSYLLLAFFIVLM